MSLKEEQTYTAPLSKNFKLLLLGVLIFSLTSVTLPVLLFGPHSKDGGSYEGLFISLGVGLITVLLIVPLLLFATTKIEVLQRSLKITTCFFFTTEVAYSDLQSAEAGPVTGIREGAGLRLLGGKTKGYLTGGPTLALKLKNGQEILASAQDPQSILATLEPRIG